eukprot:g6248.t1
MTPPQGQFQHFQTDRRETGDGDQIRNFSAAVGISLMVWLVWIALLGASLGSAERPVPRRNLNMMNSVDQDLSDAVRGLDWYRILCDGWTFGEIANEDRVLEFRKQLRATIPNDKPRERWEQGHRAVLKEEKDLFDKIIPLFKVKLDEFERAGSLVEKDCLLHSVTIMSGDLSFVGARAKALFYAGHFYQGTMLTLLAETKIWTPFRPLGGSDTTEKIVSRPSNTDPKGVKSLVWQTLRDAMVSYHGSLGLTVLTQPAMAAAQVKEMERFCAIPEDWAGSPSQVSLNHVPLKVTIAWFNACLRKALPSLLEVDKEALHYKGPQGETFLHVASLFGPGLSMPAEKSAITLLLEAGADPRTPDANGFNALHSASLWASKAAIMDLYNFRSGKWWRDLIFTMDKYGRTPLELACNATWIVKALGEDTVRLLGGPCLGGAVRQVADSAPIECLGLEQSDGREDTCGQSQQRGGVEGGERCDIQVVDLAAESMDAERFLRDFVSAQRPVLVRNAFQADASALSKRSFLLDPAIGNIAFEKAPMPFADQYGQPNTGKILLKDFVEKCLPTDPKRVDVRRCSLDGTGHVPDLIHEVARSNIPWLTLRNGFKDSLPNFSKFIFDASPDGNPPYLNCPQLTLGPSRSGTNLATAAMHNYLLFTGQRKWWLLPPMLSFSTNQFPVDFQGRAQNIEGLLQCTQRAGDLLFVPNLWARGAINEMETLAFACEFEWFDWHASTLLPGIQGTAEAPAEDIKAPPVAPQAEKASRLAKPSGPPLSQGPSSARPATAGPPPNLGQEPGNPAGPPMQGQGAYNANLGGYNPNQGGYDPSQGPGSSYKYMQGQNGQGYSPNQGGKHSYNPNQQGQGGMRYTARVGGRLPPGPPESRQRN